MPINTVEYNLNKLVKSGLVENSKNFFWSVKGRKIQMFKLAKKHIIISPRKRVDMVAIKNLVGILVAIIAVIALVGLYYYYTGGKDTGTGGPVVLISQPGTNDGGLKQFSSYNELVDFVRGGSQIQASNSGSSSGGTSLMSEGANMMTADSVASPSAAGSAKSSSSPGASSYSQTNIQVAGVDEADIVKNDGKYIYAVTDGKVVITEAYPAENMKVVSSINVNANNIFINENKLVLFYNHYAYIDYTGVRCLGMQYCGGDSKQYAFVQVYDVADKANPKLEQNFSIEGNYIDSRMIGSKVYMISSKYVDNNNPEPVVYKMGGIEREVAISDIYYFDSYEQNYVFSTVTSFDVNDGEFDNKVYLTSGTSNIYVSENNIYLTATKYMDMDEYRLEIIKQGVIPILPSEIKVKVLDALDAEDYSYRQWNKVGKIVGDYSDSLIGQEKADFDERLLKSIEAVKKKLDKNYQKTVIHKISIKDGVDYKGKGEVAGYVLNQYSMDEYDGNFRIATTTGQSWWWGWGSNINTTNNLYVLDSDLKVIGSVEDLASGEKIYSARFMGERAYMVTFRQIDPLYVISIENPKDPKVLGYLKITGVSDYLHPYDENHIIGIGRDATDEGRMQGLKISLFDVSDVTSPTEEAKYLIGDRGTSSQAIYDPKAFLFDKDKKLLVIPVDLYEKINNIANRDDYPRQTWQGAYVMNIDLNGITLRGKISHDDVMPAANEYGYTYFDYRAQVKRSLYMDDVLYTVSEDKIKANNLDTLAAISTVKINSYSPVPRKYYDDVAVMAA